MRLELHSEQREQRVGKLRVRTKPGVSEGYDSEATQDGNE